MRDPAPPAPDAGSWSSRDTLAAVALVLVAAVYFRAALTSSDTFFFRDATVLFYPTRRFLADLLLAGEWPLWNPYVDGGRPLAADVLNNVFHPLTLLYLVLPFDWAFKAFVVVQVAAAGVGLYALARSWGLGRPAALTGGLAFMLGGPLLSLASVPHFLAGVAWLPLTLLFFERGLPPGRWAPRVAAAGFLALQALGDPHMTYMTGLLLAGRVVADFRRPFGLAILTGSRRLLIVGAVAAGLAAVQLVPLAELLGESSRATGVSAADAGRWSLGLVRATEVVFPRLFGDPAAWTYWAAFVGAADRTPWLLGLYVGTSTLALAGVGLARGGDRRRVAFLAASGLLAALLALGDATPVHRLARAVLPLFAAFRFPEKWWLVTAFALASLAALGLDALLSGRVSRRGRIGLASLLVLLGAGLAASAVGGAATRAVLPRVAAALPAGPDRAVLLGFIGARIRDQLLGSAGLTCATALGIALASGAGGGLAGPFLVALLGADLLVSHHRLVPVGPETVHSAPAPLLASLPAGARPYRVAHTAWEWADLRLIPPDERGRGAGYAAWLGASLLPETGLRHRIQALGGASGTRLGGTVRLAEGMAEQGRYLDLLSLWNAEYVVTLQPWVYPELEEVPVPTSAAPVRLYRNRRSLPRAWMVPEAAAVPDPAAALAAVMAAGFNPWSRVVVEAEGLGPRQASGTLAWRAREARVVRYAPTEVVVEVAEGMAGYLVLADAHYPGWQVSGPGGVLPVWRANGAMRAVPVAAGAQTVRFRFRPTSLLVGGAVSLGTAGCLLGVALGHRAALARRRKASPG